MRQRLNAKALWLSGLVWVMVSHAGWSAGDSAGTRPWREYRTIMWVGDSAYQHPEKLRLFFQRLREMGINTAMVYGEGDPQPLLDNRSSYYVENLVNRGLCLKFNSNVRDWDKFVTEWASHGRPESGLVRDYCLDDPQWLSAARQATQTIVRKNRDHQPLAYNLRDELSTTISANPFDYDFSPLALEQFRTWLKTQYVDLGALNSEWETHFSSWAEVRPFTTDQIKNRMVTGDSIPHGQPDWPELQQLHFDPAVATGMPTRWNFAPWADFRTYMDVSLARALDQLRQAAHELDPGTPVGIEGTQMPAAFGGYDLWRLSQVLDWVEPYDLAGAREIFGSFMRDKPILTTVFESEKRSAQRRLWHLLLEGDRGCLVWWSEDCLDWKSPDYQLTPKAKALTPVLEEMTARLAQLFLRAERESDPVFIHYSQASIQVDWLLESTVDGSTWLRRFSSFEAEHNQMAKTRTGWLKALQDLGYSPQFISTAEFESGKLGGVGGAVLVLPNSWALSEKESTELDSFLQGASGDAGFREVLADGPAGTFDGHGRLRAEGRVGSVLQATCTNTACIALAPSRPMTGTKGDSRAYLAERLQAKPGSSWLDWLRERLRPLRLEVSVPIGAHARIHRFRIKTGRLIAFERNIDYQMSEDLKQAGGNEALETPLEIEATLLQPAHVYDLRAKTYLGHTDHLRFKLDPWQPSLFALLRKKVPAETIVTELGSQE